MPSHGQALNDIILPRSPFYQGAYGWMFRRLLPWQPPGKTESEQLKSIYDIATEIESEGDKLLDSDDRHQIPAGYTYLGQFVNHDITFDSTSSLLRLNDPNKLRNFRTPRFDLDSLYGSGPSVNPFLYDYQNPDDTLNGKKLLVDKLERLTIKTESGEEITDFNALRPGDKIVDIQKWVEDDLPRNSQGRALIGDSRNDENIIISQLQLAFLKFHNRQVGRFKNFEEAQRSTRWHYQWVVIHDFARRLCGKSLVDELLEGDDPGRPNLRFYSYKEQPYIPLEFSVAAFRLHTMVRPQYHLNDVLTEKRMAQGKPGSLHIFSDSGPDNDLRGSRKLNPGWTIQWDRFVRFEGSPRPQQSRPIDRNLAGPLLKGQLHFLNEADVPDIPGAKNSRYKKSLAFRNLLRGWRLGLPAGQAVAKRMGLEPLAGNDPLWLYILKEAEEKGNTKKQLLGPVGARIVAEVLVGLLAGDPQSYYSVDPAWEPDQGKKYKLKDFLTDAGVPITRGDIEKIYYINH